MMTPDDDTGLGRIRGGEKDGGKTTMDEDLKTLLKKIPMEGLIFGIGDVAEATGVSQSQIRYWERKGYIHSQVIADGHNRKFSYQTLLSVQQIKAYLDDGYTLVGAVKQAQRRHNYLEMLRSFFEDRFESLTVTDETAEIDLGTFTPNPDQHLIANKVDEHWEFRLGQVTN